MFAARESSRNNPSSLRLSGRKAIPAAIASAGERMGRAVPSTAIVPPSIGSAPAIARASSLRPLPTRPARPTISPARICSEMSLSTPLRCRPDTSRTTGAVKFCGFSKCSASAAAPNIPATRLSSVSSAAGAVRTRRPLRSTVTVSASSSTSSRKWLT